MRVCEEDECSSGPRHGFSDGTGQFTWFTPDESFILPPQAFRDDDSDKVRIAIITETDQYNNKIRSLSGEKFVYFNDSYAKGFIKGNADVFVSARPDVAAKILLGTSDFRAFLGSFKSVEQTMREIRSKL
jgi:hypothetical protein